MGGTMLDPPEYAEPSVVSVIPEMMTLEAGQGTNFKVF